MRLRSIDRSVAGVVALCLFVMPACRGEPPNNPIATALKQGEPSAWPLPLGPLPDARQACKTDFCLAADALELVLNRAAQWMAGYSKELRFDAAIGLSQTRRIVDSPDLERAWEAAVAVADGDIDHPHRRFWMPEFRSPAQDTSRWLIPEGGEHVNSNRVVSEALHCKENGWRPQATTYVCGRMRDGGGYQTTHALWALTIARAAGCIDAAVPVCLAQLRAELVQAQPETLHPQNTLDIDLYAERLLMLLLSGYGKGEIHAWARTLIGLQQSDGSWGVAADEDTYYRYDATNSATWALAEWLRFLAENYGQAALLGALRVQAPTPFGGPAFWGCSLPAAVP